MAEALGRTGCSGGTTGESARRHVPRRQTMSGTTLQTIAVIATLGIRLAAAQPSYEFEPLPSAAAGGPQGYPVAIAEDGTVLFTSFILSGPNQMVTYKNGRLNTFEFEFQSSGYPIWSAVDINSSHQIAVNNWNFSGPWYTGYVGSGYVQG